MSVETNKILHLHFNPAFIAVRNPGGLDVLQWHQVNGFDACFFHEAISRVESGDDEKQSYCRQWLLAAEQQTAFLQFAILQRGGRFRNFTVC